MIPSALITIVLAVLAQSESTSAPALVETIPVGASAWHVAAGDVTGDGREELVAACYDGSIRVIRLRDHSEVWRYETRAFPYDLAVADITGDGRTDVLVASADGRLYVLGGDGRLRWSFDTRAPLYQVAVARIDDVVRVLTGGVDRNLYVLDSSGRKLYSKAFKRTPRLIRSGDLTGDGDDEVVVALDHGQLIAFRGLQLQRLWSAQSSVAASETRQAWRPYSLRLVDLDGDGRCELLLGASYLLGNRAGIRVLGPDGAMFWEHDDGFIHRDGSGGSHSAVVACQVDPQRPGLEVVVLNGRRLYVFDKDGRSLRTGVSPVSFTNICVGEGGVSGAEVFLSSSPNGDDQVYRVRLQGRWDRAMMRIQREGKMRRVTENLDRIRRQVAAYQGEAERGRKYVHVVTAGQADTPKQLWSFFKAIEFYRRRFAYANCEFAMTLTVASDERLGTSPAREKLIPKRRMKAVEIPRLLAEFERAGVPFFVTAGHVCEPFFSVQTAEAILAACPRTCLGFLTSEDSDYGDRLERYLDSFWYPVMDLCKQHGKKAVMVEGPAWWMTIPAMSRFRRLVDGTYGEVVVMSVEDTNSRSPELNLAGRTGLLLSGSVRRVSARTVQDELTWNLLWHWEGTMTGHPFLRRQMVQCLLGAEMFEHQLPQLERGSESRFSVLGSESTELLIDMVGKGLLVPPRPDDMLGISPCMIRMNEPSPSFLREAFGGRVIDAYEEGADDRSSPFEGLAGYWGGAPVQPHYIGRYLFDQDRHAHNFIPATKYGFAAIVPSFIDPERCRWAKHAVVTDGQRFIEGAEQLTGEEAMRRVEARFRESARSMPITVEGHVFAQVQRMKSGRLRVTLIDSGYLDPDDRLATLQFQSGRSDSNMVDVLTGETLLIEERRVSVEVPAGAFRILETGTE